MLQRFVVLLILCSVFFVGISPVHAGRSNLRSELEQLHQELDAHIEEIEQADERQREYRSELASAEEQENSILALIERYDLWVESSRERLQRQRQLKQRASNQLQETRARLNEVQTSLGHREQLLSARLRKIYKQGSMSHSRMLLGAESMEDLMTRDRYYQEILNYDRTILNNYIESREELENLRVSRQTQLDRRRELEAEIATLLEEQERALAGRQRALNEVQNRQQFYRRKLDELERRQQELTRVVGQLRREKDLTEERIAALTHEFRRSRGELPWPVDSREVFRPFGNWEEDGITRNNQGIDIAVEEYSEVRAVAPGQVVYARHFRGLGMVVIVNHGDDYFTSYGSLTEVQVENGDDVTTGRILGKAGETPGSSRPRLYFQIVEGQRVLDPVEWLE